jgi:superfamily II DNA/RNA helicase
MLELGFMEQLASLSALIRPDRQALLFSATFPGKLREASESWIPNAVIIRCSAMELVRGDSHANSGLSTALKEKVGDNKDAGDRKLESQGVSVAGETEAEEHEGDATHEEDLGDADHPETFETSSLTINKTVDQTVHVCASHKKPRLLIRFIETIREKEKAEKIRQPGAMLIFCTKIKTVKFVADFLKRQNSPVEILHGQLPQSARERVLDAFKAVRITSLTMLLFKIPILRYESTCRFLKLSLPHW